MAIGLKPLNADRQINYIMKYYADFITSNGTYNNESYEFNSKREAIKTIREIGISNTFIGGSVNVSVVDNNGTLIYENTIFVK